MTKKIVLGLAAVALVGVAFAPSASAACNPDKAASTYGAGLAYWHGATPAAGSSLSGQTWQVGAPGVWSTGNCNQVDQGSGSPGFLYFSGENIGLNLHMGTCGNGCPAGLSTIAVAAYKRSPAGTEFLVATIAETPSAAVNFDYSSQGDHNLVALPRPRVTTSSRSGGIVNLSVQIPAVAGGLYGPGSASTITGYNVLSASSAADPGRDAASYTLRSTIPAAGGVAGAGSLTVDCSAVTTDQWVVTQIQFENGGVLGSSVSAPTRINCNPALADPKYKIVPKKGVPKDISPNNQ